MPGLVGDHTQLVLQSAGRIFPAVPCRRNPGEEEAGHRRTCHEAVCQRSSGRGVCTGRWRRTEYSL